MKLSIHLLAGALVWPVLALAQSSSPSVVRDPDGVLRLLPSPPAPAAGSAATVPGDEHWDDVFGAGGMGLGTVSVTDVAVTPTKIYVCGSFTEIDGMPAKNIAVYDRAARTWSPLLFGGVSGDGSYVSTIIADGETIYVGGHFDSAGGTSASSLASYDSLGWHTLGAGLPFGADVSALALYRGQLHVAGYGVDSTVLGFGLVRFDGSTYQSLGLRGNGGFVSALQVVGDQLVVGGYFIDAGDSITSGALAWNGERWRSLGGGRRRFDLIRDFAVAPSGELYASGNFEADSLRGVVRYDGVAWRPVGESVRRVATGLQASVEAIAFAANGDLFAAGSYIDSAGTSNVIDIARWDGEQWNDIGGVYYGVRDLAIAGDELVIAGSFTRAGTIQAHGIARWSGGVWSALGNAHRPGGVVRSFARATNGDIFVAGDFETAGGVAVNNIARWDGSAWHALGSGTNGDAGAMHVDAGGILHVGGKQSYVTHAGGERVENLARWDGSRWSAYPAPWTAAGSMQSITSNGKGLYVAGSATIGGEHVQGVLHSDGVDWRNIGGSSYNGVQTIITSGDDLYAGGTFDSIGGLRLGAGVPRHVAHWNGSTWSALGGSTDATPDRIVTSLAIWNGDLIVAGNGQMVSQNLARYDLETRSWLRMPEVSGSVTALASAADALYVTGSWVFDVVGSERIARYDGTRFMSGLGSGLDVPGQALIADQFGRVYVGGVFTRAGGKESIGIARWSGSALSIDDERAPHRLRAVAAPNAFAGTSTLAFTLERAAHVRITLVDGRGLAIATLADSPMPAGENDVTVDAARLASGAYFLHMTVDAASSVIPIRIIR
jgi:trimeric autotransporter adhesin